MNPERKSTKRKRGVFLTAQGIRRLKGAIKRSETRDNQGNRYTIEDLSRLTGVSKSTMTRLWDSRVGVDQKRFS